MIVEQQVCLSKCGGCSARSPCRACGQLRRVRRLRSQRSEEHTSELQSPCNLVCRLLLEKKKHFPKQTHGTYGFGLPMLPIYKHFYDHARPLPNSEVRLHPFDEGVHSWPSPTAPYLRSLA